MAQVILLPKLFWDGDKIKMTQLPLIKTEKQKTIIAASRIIKLQKKLFIAKMLNKISRFCSLIQVYHKSSYL